MRTRRQKATLGSGIIRHPTPLPSRLMHAAVQLLRAADEPPEAADGDWRSLLYGAQSDDDSEDGDCGLGALGGLCGVDGSAIESLVRTPFHLSKRDSVSITQSLLTTVPGQVASMLLQQSGRELPCIPSMQCVTPSCTGDHRADEPGICVSAARKNL